jgi:hypothetical protein
VGAILWEENLQQERRKNKNLKMGENLQSEEILLALSCCSLARRPTVPKRV